MTTKDKILNILEENRGEAISGESMASLLEISRNSVWKAINGLKNDGYIIESCTNKGYMLGCENDILSAPGIKMYLPSHIDCKLKVHKQVTSTNTIAKELAVSGTAQSVHGTVIMAEQQSEGKGRRGRSFFSPPGHGIYMSLVLDSSQMGHDPTLITVYTAVAVSEAVQEICNVSPKIKWVNDLFLNGKKFCGISAEAVMDIEGGTIGWIVVGIGINFTLSEEVPSEFVPIVGSIFEGKPPVTRNRLVASIIEKMLSGTKVDQLSLIEKYKQKMFMLGKKVRVEWADAPYYATALDVNQFGNLLVQNEAGEIMTLTAGEISVRAD